MPVCRKKTKERVGKNEPRLLLAFAKQKLKLNNIQVKTRVVRLAKNDLGMVVSVRFLQKNCGFWFSFGFTKLTAVLVFSVQLGLHLSVDIDAIFHLRLYGTTVEMTYFRAELVQLIVSRSDSELQVQRYSMRKNTLAVDPIMLKDEL